MSLQISRLNLAVSVVQTTRSHSQSRVIVNNISLFLAWLVQAARARQGMPYAKRLELEIIDAYNENWRRL